VKIFYFLQTPLFSTQIPANSSTGSSENGTSGGKSDIVSALKPYFVSASYFGFIDIPYIRISATQHTRMLLQTFPCVRTT
jgi:hypothetical protein